MSASKPVRVRYAPSPTGDFHVGGARTALFNYLFARRHGGSFILRIEDTDQKRYNPEALGWLMDGLRYLGLDWDEGPEVGGAYGPYTQTERLAVYQRYCEQLLSEGRAYRCFCSAERIQEASKAREKQGLRPGYDRHCRTLDPAEATQRASEAHTVRFKAPIEGEITVHDLIRGEITFGNEIIQDAVLMKSDGIPTYHMANVIDDHLMEISHVLRGDEWVNSLPLHKHLYDSFGWEPPLMAHLPLILNPTGKGKMSKREGRAPDGQLLPVFTRGFQELGYLPEAMINFMALLGWSYDDKTEIMSRDELIERFTLERVNASPAVWNYEKLDHINGAYIRRLPVDELSARLAPFVKKAGFEIAADKLRAVAPLIQERISKLSDIATVADFFFVKELPEYEAGELIPRNSDVASTRKILEHAGEKLADNDFTVESLESALRSAADELGVKPGQMFQPIRVAACGRKNAPPLFETLAVLGKETTLARIGKAVQKLS